jgi:hypothetical protein
MRFSTEEEEREMKVRFAEWVTIGYPVKTIPIIRAVDFVYTIKNK